MNGIDKLLYLNLTAEIHIKKMKLIVALTLIFFMLPFWLTAQNAIDIPKINSTITLDGDLNELEWNNAYTITGFKQTSPNLGTNTTERANVKIMYDEQYLYIGGLIYFSNPSQMFATTLERDTDQAKDDYIEIHIDTYNDIIDKIQGQLK